MISQCACSCTTKHRNTPRPRVPGALRLAHSRKAALVGLGAWGLRTGCGWLAHAVHVALEREGLVHG